MLLPKNITIELPMNFEYIPVIEDFLISSLKVMNYTANSIDAISPEFSKWFKSIMPKEKSLITKNVMEFKCKCKKNTVSITITTSDNKKFDKDFALTYSGDKE